MSGKWQSRNEALFQQWTAALEQTRRKGVGLIEDENGNRYMIVPQRREPAATSVRPEDDGDED